ncbi:MAG: OmpA family protein [Terracidiphilus sp.]
MIKAPASSRIFFPRQLVFAVLAVAISIPACAQQGQSATGSPGAPAAVDSQQPLLAPPPPPAPVMNTPKEGFWGRINPFARKKWVKRQVTPLKDQISELDAVNAQNAREIQDVDQRAQAGIHQAQSTADAANQTALDASGRAQQADAAAQGAGTSVDHLSSTVRGLDQYRQAEEITIRFHRGQPVLSAAARLQLNQFAEGLTGQKGYILEIEAHSPQAGGAGLQSSSRMAEAVERYLVTEHEIPIYRMHAVALGNARTADTEPTRSAPPSSVCIRLMENSLAAQDDAAPHDAASLTGAERPARP